MGIDQISTRWPMIRDPVKFVMRYAQAIQGYLGVFLKNPHDVEDVCQSFLLRVVERGMVEEVQLRGRFRDYLIAAVRNAALAQMRRRSLAVEEGVPLAEIPEALGLATDEEWLSRWRRVVLESVWGNLERYQREHSGNLGHTVLRTLVEHPGENSIQLAGRISRLCGYTIGAETFRKQVSRARRLFAELLVAETAQTLDNPTPLAVEEELIDIGVMKYVKSFLPPDWRTSGKLLDAD